MREIVIKSLKDNSLIMLACFLVFLAGTVSGFVIYPFIRENVEEIVNSFYEGVITDTPLATARNIFFRNIQATSAMIIVGFTVIGPPMLLFFNGLASGIVLEYALTKGVSIQKLFYAVAPHALPEVLAFLLTASLGIRIGMSLVFPNGGRIKSFKKSVKEASFVYITVVVPLLLTACLLEVFVSAKLAAHTP